ncbi:MAG: hypothetical protein MUF25_19955, partial [Pirellulaceae bacterium]|nr:hypothetical protein [Pirellulaceae bacterium]
MKTTLTYQAAQVLVLAAALAGSLPNANASEQVTPTFPSAAKTAASHVRPLASIELYNPTPWTEPVAVEVPVGRIATPGMIDWAGVRLMLDGKELSFAIREGRVHWKSRLTAPVPQPRAEDLLVFSLPLPRGVWIRVEIIPGRPTTGSALTRGSGVCTVSYPDLKVAIDEASATLTNLSVSGKPLLAGPLELGLYAVEDGTMAFTGPLGCSYDSPTLTIKKGAKLKAPQARLASSSSSLALTELNFVIEPAQGPMLAVTYRIHPSGLIEIISDERPWQGRSPWLDFAVEFNLKLAGTKQLLPLLQTRHPFYGFKDYSAPVRLAGALYRTPQAQVLEFGEETINGRRWARQLYIDERPDSARTKGLVEMVCEGPIVQVTPVSTPLPQVGVQVDYPEDSKAAAETLVKALTDCGLLAQLGGNSAPSGETCLVTLRMAADPHSEGLEGDGFSIRRDHPGQGLTILAGTRLGLLRGALKAAEHLRCNPAATEGAEDNAGIGHLAPLLGATGRGSDSPAAKTLPLIAGNPAVDVRGGGFGGGNHEVDFPYDTEAEWKRVFDNLLASGMNNFTCLGMWGNWKLPALYKYMPELRSTAPLHDRGAKVWLWIPVGCVPTTFAARYPEAMCTGSQKVPRIMHPKYRQYLDAYFREILETYPLDGFMLVRDDNGGLDQSAEYQSFLETSRTKDPAWEQYLLIYDLLRNKGFQGTVIETMNSAGYTYVHVDIGKAKIWAAAPETKVKTGDTVSIPPGTLMRNHHSKTLNRTFDGVYFVSAISVAGMKPQEGKTAP